MTQSFKRTCKDLLYSILIKSVRILLLVLLLAIVVGIFYGFYKPLTFLISPTLSAIAATLLLHSLLFTICKSATFPGSTWIWRRMMENHFQAQVVKNLLKRVKELSEIVEFITKEKNLSFSIKGEDAPKIAKTLISLTKLFNKQIRQNTISKKQREMLGLLSGIQQLLHDTKVVIKDTGSSLSLWDFILGTSKDILKKFNSRAGLILAFEDLNQGNVLLGNCKIFEKILDEIINKKPVNQSIVRWMFEDSFGSLDQMREELDEVYACKRISVKVNKQVTLDCMLICGPSEAKSWSKNASSASQSELNDIEENHKDGNKFDTTKATMIFCQPNAGYYEIMHYDNEWINVYLKEGLNVFFWNYRGFGRSSGTPSPDALKKDGEAIVDYVRQELGVKKIGVHGQSLGGLVACHMAKTKNLDYLCADRTFTTVVQVAEATYGKLAGILYKFLTLWTDDVSKDYLEATCYKTVAFDTRDEVIDVQSSLKHGIMKKVIEKKIVHCEEPLSPALKANYCLLSPFKLVDLAKKLVYTFQKETYNYIANKELKQYYEPLSKEETLALFWAFNRISEVILSVTSDESLAEFKPKSSYAGDSKAHTNIAIPMKITKLKTTDTNGSIQLSKLNNSENNSRHDDGFTILEISAAKEEAQTNILLLDQNKNLAKKVNQDNSEYNRKLELMKTTLKKSYTQAFGKEGLNTPKTQELAFELSPIFEDFEAGGIWLLDIMEMDPDTKLQVFRHFIHSFEVWGSRLPLDIQLTNTSKAPLFFQQNALDNIEDLIKKIKFIIDSKTKVSATQGQRGILSSILKDLELIISILSSLHRSLSSKMESQADLSSPTDYSPVMSLKEVKSENELKNTLGDRLIDVNDNLYDQKGNIQSMIGNLIPLTCGHNGAPSYIEMEVFKHHLRNSSLLK